MKEAASLSGLSGLWGLSGGRGAAKGSGRRGTGQPAMVIRIRKPGTKRTAIAVASVFMALTLLLFPSSPGWSQEASALPLAAPPAAGSPRSSGSPSFSQKAYISGRVTTGTSALSDVQVTAASKGGGMAMAVNAGNGNYALGVWEGEWTVFASKKGYVSQAPITVKVGPNEARENVDILMKKSTAYIEGIVVDEGDKSLPRSFVMAAPMPKSLGRKGGEEEEGAEGAPLMGTSSVFQGTCDLKGNFALQTMAGTYLLIASYPGYEMSPRNPLPQFPGMEEIPAEYRAQIAQSMAGAGIQVTVAEGETKRNVKIILRKSQRYQGKSSREIEGRTEKLVPQPNLLVGKPQATPNNVLHWTRKTRSETPAAYAVVRSTVPFEAKQKGEVKVFQFMELPYGEPHEEYYSFTDSTAIKGKPYWYVVYETGTAGVGPYSNSVQILTR